MIPHWYPSVAEACHPKEPPMTTPDPLEAALCRARDKAADQNRDVSIKDVAAEVRPLIDTAVGRAVKREEVIWIRKLDAAVAEALETFRARVENCASRSEDVASALREALKPKEQRDQPQAR